MRKGNHVKRATVVLFLAASVGCMGKRIEEFPSAEYTRGDLFGYSSPGAKEPYVLPPAIASEVARLVEEAYPHPSKWMSVEDKKDTTKIRLSAGSKLYQQHCLSCHGKTGAGDMGIALTISPRPRDFRRGTFKWKSTPRASKPTKEDLARTINRGIAGTAMQSFSRLPSDDIERIVDFVVYLAQRGDLERRLMITYATEGPSQSDLDKSSEKLSDEDVKEFRELLVSTRDESREAIESAWQDASKAVVNPKTPYADHSTDTPEFAAALERGRALFVGPETGCTKCHGPDGRGTASLAPEHLLDEWGFENPPRNLTQGIFRGGSEPIDLYRRIEQGIAGSAMPGIAATTKLSEEQVWDLVDYVRSLAKTSSTPAPGASGGL